MKKVVLFILILIQVSQAQVGSNQVCEYLNNSEYTDLLTVIGGLQEAISKIPKDCGEQVINNSYSEAKKLQESASKISEYWNSQALVTQSPLDFGNSVQSAVSSVRSLTNNLQNGSLNQVCVNHFKSGQGVEFLSKLSDVGMSLGPMLILAKAMGAAISMPMIVGVIGISSVANIATDLIGNDEIQIADPEQQKKVLKAVCDYRRAKKQMDYLIFIQDGVSKIDEQTTNLDERIKALKASLPLKFHPIFDYYNEGRSLNTKKATQIEKAKKWANEFNQILNRDSSDNFQCTASKSLFSTSDPHSLLSLQEYQLGKKNDVSSLAALSLHKTSVDVMQEIVSLQPTDSKKVMTCASSVKKWKGLFTSLVRELDSINERNIENDLNELRKDSRLPDILAELKSLKKEHLLFKRIQTYMQKAPTPGAVISKAMVYSQFRDVHAFLLGKGRFKFTKGNVTLVGAWLDHMYKLFSESSGKFTSEFFRLNQQLKSLLISRKISQGAPISRPKVAENSALTYTLELVNQEHFSHPTQKQEWADSCRSLKGLYSLWDKADTYLKSITYFCDSIADIRDPEMNHDIVKMCFGSLDIRNSKSILADAQAYFKQINGTAQQGALVEDAMVRLRCELPSKP